MIGGGILKLERVQVICPVCGQQIEAVAGDGQVKGYCAVANQYVDFPVEAQRVPVGKHPTDETRAKLSAAAKKRWQDPGSYALADWVATPVANKQARGS